MNIIDVFSSIIDSIRSTGVITGISEASGISTITSVNSLKASEWVTINDVNYQVISADTNEFTIYATLLVATSWKALAPYFDKGNVIQLANDKNISDSDRDSIRKSQKYPSIWLVLDIKGTINNNALNTTTYPNTKVIILGKTKATHNVNERLDNVFKPTLYPIRDDLIKAIPRSIYVDYRSRNPLDHDSVDRFFWGSDQNIENGRGGKNKLPDPLDAIEIDVKDLNIVNNNLNCI